MNNYFQTKIKRKFIEEKFGARWFPEIFCEQQDERHEVTLFRQRRRTQNRLNEENWKSIA